MPCPFPGMDPYLEMPPFWGDFAPTLLACIRNELVVRLTPRYDARIEEYLMLTEDDFHRHRRQPDVTVSTTEVWSAGSAGVAVGEPVTTELQYPAYEPRTQRRIKIIHLPSERVVTVMELLSPANKAAGEGGLDMYLEKRAELLGCRSNLVELDLLRGGERLPMSGPLPPGDYYAFVGRTGLRPRCEVIAWSLRSPLPDIPIPLISPDPDLTLDFASVFRAAYEPAIYDRRLRYREPLAPRFVPPTSSGSSKRSRPSSDDRFHDCGWVALASCQCRSNLRDRRARKHQSI